MNNNIVGSLRGEGHEVHKAQIEYGHNFHLNNNNMIMIIIIIIIIIIVIIIIIIIIYSHILHYMLAWEFMRRSLSLGTRCT